MTYESNGQASAVSHRVAIGARRERQKRHPPPGDVCYGDFWEKSQTHTPRVNDGSKSAGIDSLDQSGKEFGMAEPTQLNRFEAAGDLW